MLLFGRTVYEPIMGQDQASTSLVQTAARGQLDAGVETEGRKGRASRGQGSRLGPCAASLFSGEQETCWPSASGKRPTRRPL